MIGTSDKLLAHMGNPSLTDAQLLQIETVILPGVQRRLEDHCNRPLELKQVYESITPDCYGYIWFGVTPVWQVISVKDIQGNVVTVPTPVVPTYVPSTNPDIQDLNLIGTSWVDSSYKMYVGVLNPAGIYIGQPASYYVTYIAGIDCTKDSEVEEAIYEVAARKVNAMFIEEVGMRRGAVEQATTTDNRPPEWTEEELAQFDRLRRRVAV